MADRADRFESRNSNEWPWTIPLDDADSSLEMVTSPRTFPTMNPVDMPEGLKLYEPLDLPMYQGSVPRPAARTRPSIFSSKGTYSAECDLDGNSLTASRLPDGVTKFQGSIDGKPSTPVRFPCLYVGCNFKGETYAELR